MTRSDITEAVALLDAGELVVVPTDTRYALAADALNDDAIHHLFEATQRAADRPLSVLVPDVEGAQHVAHVTPLARQIAGDRWPGPVALVLKARPWVPDALTAGQDSVAVRAPAQELARELARHFGPVALASLERAAHPAAKLAIDVGPLPGGRPVVVDARV